MRIKIFLLALVFLGGSQSLRAQNEPERAILFVIDGVHTEAPERLDMPAFTGLAEEGALVEKTTAIMPYHPTHGSYAEVHTSSYPNPVMMTGTIFLEAGQPMLQDRFESSAFIANTSAYQSITEGYDYVIQRGETDKFAVDRAIDVLESDSIDFMRVHLQNAGSAGSQSLSAAPEAPYRHNIWHEEAPYVKAIEEADRQLQRFVSSLKEMQKWENTLLVVTSDHGQTKTGWHPTLPEESWLVPTVFYGAGVAEGTTVEWADLIDLIPTIAEAMGVEPPNDGGGSGRILQEVLRASDNEYADSRDADSDEMASRLLELNRVLKEYRQTEAEMIRRSDTRPYLNSQVMRLERDFYGLGRILDWSEMESIDALIDHNRQIVGEMKKALSDSEEN